MKMGIFASYRNHLGSIEVTDGMFHGKIINTTDLITYEADSLENLENEFHKAVDDYIVMLYSIS